MSRASVVGMLVAVEIVIVGMAIYAIGHGGRTFAAGMHHVDFTATSIAPLAAGSAPAVAIDDAESRVRVSVSSDGLIHVRDLTQIHGALFSNSRYPRLTVTRTSDGVRIERPGAQSFSIGIFGLSTQAIEVAVPRDSRVEIARCAGADVSGITGGVSVHSMDGHVTLADLQGSVDARSDNGYLDASDVRGDRLALESMDGHLALQNIAVTSLDATTRDGHIQADGLNVSGEATLQTDDGTIQLQLAPGSDLTVDASTRDGHISVDGNITSGDDSAQRSIRLGAGTGHMKVATADGSILIHTNGASQSDGL
jgi:hypothetical protein